MKKKRVTNYVRTFRHESGLSQRELGFLLGSNRGSHLSKHELDRGKPTFNLVIAYEIAYRTSIAELFPEEYATTDYMVRKRAAQMVEKLSKRSYVGKNKQKIEFLAKILQAPDIKRKMK